MHPGKDKSFITLSNGYISNHNKMWCPRPKFKVSLYLHFCCFWINVTQINFENIKRNTQRIISDSCFQLKSWFNVDARAPSIPLLNFPFKFSPWKKISISCLCVWSSLDLSWCMRWITLIWHLFSPYTKLKAIVYCTSWNFRGGFIFASQTLAKISTSIYV